MQAKSTILLVDESRFFLTIENQFLRRAPVDIVEAGSAREAVEACRNETPHLVYMAFNLPDQNGAECCQRIKNDSELSGIPIVLICNENEESQINASRRAGCDAVLTKPLDRHRFLEIGRSFLAGVREPRHPCLITVHACCGDKEFSSNGLDISSGGVFLECKEPLELGASLELELHLSRPGEPGPRIKSSGRVAWLNDRDEPTKPHHPVGVGVKFVGIPSQSASVLNGFLRTMEKARSGPS